MYIIIHVILSSKNLFTVHDKFQMVRDYYKLKLTRRKVQRLYAESWMRKWSFKWKNKINFHWENKIKIIRKFMIISIFQSFSYFLTKYFKEK